MAESTEHPPDSATAQQLPSGTLARPHFGFGSGRPARLSPPFPACWNGSHSLCNTRFFLSSSQTEPTFSFSFPQRAAHTLVPQQVRSSQCTAFPLWATTRGGPVTPRDGHIPGLEEGLSSHLPYVNKNACQPDVTAAILGPGGHPPK